MKEEAMSLPHPVFVDRTYLKLSPDSAGMQHDERKATISRMWPLIVWCAGLFMDRKHLGWPEGLRKIPSGAPLHPTVLERFGQPAIVAYDDLVLYRPEVLRNHEMVKKYYS